MTDIAILIPAAGSSSRMRGRDKLLQMVDGRPLITRQAEMASATGLRVLVTLPPDRPGRRGALADFDGVKLQDVPDASSGMAASLRAGAGWAREAGAAGLMIVLADMPELQTADLAALADAFRTSPDNIWRASDDSGGAGHPVIFPARLLPELETVTGDDGGRAVLAGKHVRLLRLPGLRATTDLDTPEDWHKWRSKTKR